MLKHTKTRHRTFMMSASSRLVPSAGTRSPLFSGCRTLFQPAIRPLPASTVLQRKFRDVSAEIPALAILIPRRALSTETQTTRGVPVGPPPGFNPKLAKTPPIEPGKFTKPSINAAEGGPASASNPDLIPKIESTVASKTNTTNFLSPSELMDSKQKAVERKDTKRDEKKTTLMQRVKKEIMHYWDGTKLLATEVRISTRLALKMAAGYELSRREHKQLRRTVQDLARLVPFSVFIIVPFAELLLPVALKLFPNLLPSTYEGQKSKDTKATNLRATRKEVSNFLRETLKETGLPLSSATAQREEFAEFFRKVRATGEAPTAEDVIKVCKIFKDDLTLDNLSRPQLVGMCRYMNLNTFGTDMMLRYQIRHRMRQIKRDDKAISFEGVDSLSVPELQMACAGRGIRTHGVSPGRLRDDLQCWLDLRLKYGVPSTLLVLSNAFMYAQGKESEISSQIDALTGVLSSIPEELFHEIELEVHNAEGAATNKQRLEVLKEQQELIEEENEQDEENKESGHATPRDTDFIDEEDRRLEAQSAKEDGLQTNNSRDSEQTGTDLHKVQEQHPGNGEKKV